MMARSHRHQKRSKLVLGGLVVLTGLTLVVRQRPALVTQLVAVVVETQQEDNPQERRNLLDLKLSNEYERREGRPIGDGMYPFEWIAEVYAPTLCSVSGALSCKWTFFDGERNAESLGGGGSSCEVEHTWIAIGAHVIQVETEVETKNWTVHVRYVRRELRALSDGDRDRYLNSVETLYKTSQDAGELLFGGDFKSAAWLIREHLYGAASKDCDHWHDDAGFLNHHVGITRQFELSLQTIDPRVSAHYWDYTLDADGRFDQSRIFDPEWFGASSPGNSEHVIDSGRFGFTRILSDVDSKFSLITNPYGLLRSPWNTNPTPFLMRYQKVLGRIHDGYSVTTCGDFREVIRDYDWLGSLVSKLNGKLHGPIHIMIGGHWWLNETDAEFLGSSEGARSRALLASKFLWRQGILRCPETCALDASTTCVCHCPSEIVGSTSEDALTILNATGLFAINSNWLDVDPRRILDFLCHVGRPGEMFTSAAPQDPTFWPLHGNAERFVHLVRLLAARGEKHFNEDWGYAHVQTGLDSDTNVVCDWSQAQGLQLPRCVLGATCPGHRADDVLPFFSLGFDPDPTLDAQLVSNLDFYQATSPLNPHLPYVYDRISYWPACANDTIWYSH